MSGGLKLKTLVAAIRLALLSLLALGLAACKSAPERPPVTQVVEKIVYVDRKFPSWATEPLPDPVIENGTLGELRNKYDERGAVIELASCHRALMRQLERNEPVDPLTCYLVPLQ